MAKHAKRLSELSLRGRRVLFSSKPALSARQCGKHLQLIDCVRLQRFTFTRDDCKTDRHLASGNLVPPAIVRGSL